MLAKQLTMGFLGLTQSKKGMLSLIVLTVSAVLAAVGRLDGTAWAASMTVVSGVYCFTQSATDRAFAGQVSTTTTVVGATTTNTSGPTNAVVPNTTIVTPDPPIVVVPPDPLAAGQNVLNG